MRSAIYGLLLPFLLFSHSEAQAAPITLQAESELLINFDLTGETPPPPFDFIAVHLEMEEFTGQNLNFLFYSGLNGQDLVTSFPQSYLPNPPSPYDATISFDGPAGLLDGLFSVGLLLGVSAFDPDVLARLTVSTAEGLVDDERTGAVPGVVAVPEPALLLLFGASVFVVLTRMRRWQQN